MKARARRRPCRTRQSRDVTRDLSGAEPGRQGFRTLSDPLTFPLQELRQFLRLNGCLRMYSCRWASCASHVTALCGRNATSATSHLSISASPWRWPGSRLQGNWNLKRALHTPQNGLESLRMHQRRRGISWSSLSARAQVLEPTDLPDNEEDAARAAILDKVMKGRQPSELMLRCEYLRMLLKL